MARKLGHAGETPKGRLLRLEHRYGLNRSPLREALDEAIKRQGKLDKFIKVYAHEAANWKTLGHRLRKRQRANRRAAVIRVAEIEESLLDDVMKARLVDRESYLSLVIDRGLEGRARAARLLERICRLSTRRKPHRPTGVIVNECLKSLVEQVEDSLRPALPKGPKGVAFEYVSALAQICGLMPQKLLDPAAALTQQLRRHTKSAPSSDTVESLIALRQALGALPVAASPLAGTTVDELAVSARDVALDEHLPQARWVDRCAPPLVSARPAGESSLLTPKVLSG